MKLILDAGAFIGFERGDVGIRAMLRAARQNEVEVVTSATVVGQVWRNGSRQALLARLLVGVHVKTVDEPAGRRAGELLAQTSSADVIDALVAGLASHGDTLVTSDPDDLKTLLSAARVRAAVRTA